MGGVLVIKLVKPTKVLSRSPDYAFLHQFLPSQTEADVGTAGAGVLGKADATVPQKLGGLDPPDGVFDELAEFLALLVGDRGVQVLNLDQSLADEDHLGDFGNARNPGVADQLRIQSQQSIGLLWVAAGGGLPLDQAACPIQLPQGIDIGYEVVRRGNGSGELDL